MEDAIRVQHEPHQFMLLKCSAEIGMRLVEMDADRQLLNLLFIFLEQVAQREVTGCPRHGQTQPLAFANQPFDRFFGIIGRGKEVHRVFGRVYSLLLFAIGVVAPLFRSFNLITRLDFHRGSLDFELISDLLDQWLCLVVGRIVYIFL